MATKKQIQIVNELHKIRCIVGLCGFASEARRILTDISVSVEIDQDFGTDLDNKLAARNEWLEHDDHLPEVLKEISYRLESVMGLADGLDV